MDNLKDMKEEHAVLAGEERQELAVAFEEDAERSEALPASEASRMEDVSKQPGKYLYTGTVHGDVRVLPSGTAYIMTPKGYRKVKK